MQVSKQSRKRWLYVFPISASDEVKRWSKDRTEEPQHSWDGNTLCLLLVMHHPHVPERDLQDYVINEACCFGGCLDSMASDMLYIPNMIVLRISSQEK